LFGTLVTEEVEIYLKEMLFIVEHGSNKQAFLLCRKIDKYLHQADNDLQDNIVHHGQHRSTLHHNLYVFRKQG
jgi:hypothetical protein